MRRAWKHAIAIAAFFVARPALAFHAGKTVDTTPGAGGGGGLTCIGLPTERGLTCAACHTDAPGKITINLNEPTPALFSSFSYEPGKTYPLTATLNGDATKIDHFNSLAFVVVDDKGATVGTIGNFTSDDFYQAQTGAIISAGTKWNITTWTFSWTAPSTPGGRVHLHVAAVSGNGANVPGLTITDPFGDDVFVGKLDLDPAGATASREDDDASPFAFFACAIFFRRRGVAARDREG